MQIIVNDESRDVAEAATVAAVIDALGLSSQRCAAELNGDIVPRSSWGERKLVAGDRLEVVRAIGGG
ncbi:MAG: sulfur carrier protein ThiS [Nevskia sp.]|nr:sulfur carrier protein ThiS [Nevskia sp.]